MSSAHEVICKEAMIELRKSKVNMVLEHVEGTDDLLHYIADRFNGLRAQLALCCDLLKNADSEAKKYVIQSKALAQGDFGLLLDEEPSVSPTFDIEDATEFTAKYTDLLNTKRFDTRMTLCVKLNAMIGEAIERWKSKIDKMKSLSSLTGATPAEVLVADKKIIQFNEAIDILRKRGSLISKVYFDTRKDLTDFISEMNEKFMVINYNELTNKEKSK